MKTHQFKTEQWFPLKRDVVFPFFASARNLQIITPPWLDFTFLTPEPIEMRVGARIDYRMRVHGLPIRWQSEITVWDPPFRFVDEQRRGPYRRWVHQHTFVERSGGTACQDEIEYAVPGGSLVNWLLVRQDIRKIFEYRRAALARMLPQYPAERASNPVDAGGTVA